MCNRNLEKYEQGTKEQFHYRLYIEEKSKKEGKKERFNAKTERVKKKRMKHRSE